MSTDSYNVARVARETIEAASNHLGQLKEALRVLGDCPLDEKVDQAPVAKAEEYATAIETLLGCLHKQATEKLKIQELVLVAERGRLAAASPKQGRLHLRPARRLGEGAAAAKKVSRSR